MCLYSFTEIQCLAKVFTPLHYFHVLWCCFILNCFSITFFHINLNSIHYNGKAKKRKRFLTYLQMFKKIKTFMIPLHKYSYPYLGWLEFISGAFILLVYVTTLQVKLTCGKFSWMIWRCTSILINGPTADNAYQSKKTSPGVKITVCRAQKLVCVKPRIWGSVQKKILLHWRVT